MQTITTSAADVRTGDVLLGYDHDDQRVVLAPPSIFCGYIRVDTYSPKHGYGDWSIRPDVRVSVLRKSYSPLRRQAV